MQHRKPPKTRVKRAPRSRRAAYSKKSRTSAPEDTAATPNQAVDPGADQQETEYTVILRFKEAGSIRNEQFRLTDRRLYPETKRWTYVLRNRERLTDGARKETTSPDLDRLASTFAPSHPSNGKVYFESLLKAVANSELVEVVLPWTGDQNETGYAARLFPWEMVLTFLTRPYRQSGQGLTVVRQLAITGAAPEPKEPVSLLAVCNAPGKIDELFNLRGECELVVNVLGLPKCAGDGAIAINPLVSDLEARIKEGKPGVIHLTGVDPMWLRFQPWNVSTHRGLFTNIMSAVETEKARDGLVMAGPNGTYATPSPEELARVVTVDGHAPQLVAISSCYSGRRVAPRIVASGAYAAVGFQDTVTDAAAETFFSAFYRQWRARGWPHPGTILPDALHKDMPAPTPSVNLAGGVVVWSRVSVFEAPKRSAAAREGQVSRAIVKLDPMRDLEVVPRTFKTLNYSLLHNGRPLFKEFYVRKQREGSLPPLTVKVQLDVGGPTQPCIFSCQLPNAAGPLDLLAQVSTPLIAPLLRRVSESLRSNLYLHVACGETTIYEKTIPITLLPVDEWRDDGKDHCWLPSFVLPRDPAVLKIVTSALRYLRAIADDPQAGFSGYQGIQGDGSNAAEIVDPQVRAIWAALQHEFRLAYINPPPSYTLRAQRLRSPSQILAGGAATCIDLALLFASCLEYIGILPAIFLIAGHAFPGYWRDNTSWDGLKDILKEADEVLAAESADADPDPVEIAPSREEKLGAKWMLTGLEHFPAITSYTRMQTLVPFESTFVTANRSFAEAMVQGRDNLNPRTFDAMIDVGRARNNDVTPLPILET